jgi:hypothetical protein
MERADSAVVTTGPALRWRKRIHRLEGRTAACDLASSVSTWLVNLRPAELLASLERTVATFVPPDRDPVDYPSLRFVNGANNVIWGGTPMSAGRHTPMVQQEGVFNQAPGGNKLGLNPSPNRHRRIFSSRLLGITSEILNCANDAGLIRTIES